MALTGIVNLADRLVNQSQPQTEQSFADTTPTTAQGSGTLKSSAAPVTSVTAADEFTLSAQTPAAGATAQAAGLFSVATFSLFTAAAKFLLGDSGSGSSATAKSAPTGSDASAPAVTTATSSAVNPSAQNATPAAGNSSAIASPTNADNTLALATAPVNSTVSNLPFFASSATPGSTALALIPPSSVAQSASVNSELQSLNTALSALGLPPSDIAVIDRIAALLKDFSPAAYSDLLHQFETLAQSQLAPSATAPPPTTSATAGAPASGASAVDVNNAATASSALNVAAITPTAQPSSPQTTLSIANPAAAAANGAAGAIPKESRAAGATFQVQDLVIHFASITETQTNNASSTQTSPQNATNSKATSRDSSTSVSQLNVLNLGVEEISVTLNNSLGQRAHVHVGQSAANTNSTSSLVRGIPLTKSANA
jgi:hypothetical protein